MMHSKTIRAGLIGTTAAILVAWPAMAAAATPAGSADCTALGQTMSWPEPGTRVVSALWHETGPAPTPPMMPGMPPMPPVTLPAHCEIVGSMHERTGVDGQHYAIRFHLRMPTPWNGKFFMQGGGGTNGELGDAIGRMGAAPPALVDGYAVLSQDSGHDNATNTVPERGGASAFGFDPQARADYGGASLPPTVKAAKAAVRRFYGRTPDKSYFVGCSKGGQEGMMAATRYPDLFDGIVASAPGFALPRAAIAEMWDTQAIGHIVTEAGQSLTQQSLSQSFSAADFALIGQAVLAACDKDDGVADGMVGAFTQCTSDKVLPQLKQRACADGKQEGCLSLTQIDALRHVHDGARSVMEERIYAGFYWDAGWADAGWRIWKIGMGPVPSINVMMGAPSLAAIFTTPPTGLPDAFQAKLNYAMAFDFNEHPSRIYAKAKGFPRSAWQDIGGARDGDLSAFSKRGGKLIVTQGVSDPVFSLADTIDWYASLDARTGQQAARFARLFPVPGMGHCQGGPATDGYDAFAALVNWVEKSQAPDRMEATAGPRSPWPGRTRPLCAYPKIARYKGSGSIEQADNFTCA
ncbi:tannase/feruloyl esterase family alpha/beta hydrolase [Sphingomonas sp. ASY06-1R]|uniref:tannase/feruloyl esterase family alpha/beta hydrolase n=1 Tax=Sphingomonas sp. ASY06-1R TaxID=3445771 RepID=UPI003FA33000